MKKKILLLASTLLLCFILFGCGRIAATAKDNKDNFKNVNNKYVDMAVIYRAESVQNTTSILYDRNTKVMYLCVEGYRSIGITPIYNSDGTIKLYDGAEASE